MTSTAPRITPEQLALLRLLPLTAPCGEPDCPGWVVVDESIVERCDVCCYDYEDRAPRVPFDDDEEAWCFIESLTGDRVIATRQRDWKGRWLPDSEPGAVRGEMGKGSDPIAVHGLHCQLVQDARRRGGTGNLALEDLVC